MVSAVEDILIGMRRERGEKIDGLQRGLRIRRVDHGALAVIRCALREEVGIKLCRRRDQCERYRHAGLGKRVRRLHGAAEMCVIRSSVGFDQALAIAEKDAVILLLALRQLGKGFRFNPAVPAGKLIAAIRFKARGILPGEKGREAERRKRLQTPVFLFREGLVRQKKIQQEKPADKYRKEGGYDPIGSF